MLIIYLLKTQDTKKISNKFARYVLGNHISTDGDKLNIAEDRYGKPYLVDYPNVYFSISHTKGVIACAISDNPVGIDIESIRKPDLRVVEYYFSQQEQKYIFADNEKLNIRFTEVWTKKEAFLKFLGTGIELPIQKFNVLKDRINIVRTIYYNNYIISYCSTKIFQCRFKIIDNKLDFKKVSI